VAQMGGGGLDPYAASMGAGAPPPVPEPVPVPEAPSGTPALTEAQRQAARENDPNASPQVRALMRSLNPDAPAPAQGGSAQQTSQGPQLVYTQGSGPQTSTSKTEQSTGLTDEDRKKVDAANTGAIEARRVANDAEAEARTQQVNAEFMRLTEDEKKNLAAKAAEEEQEKRYTELLEQNSKELKASTERPVDPSQAFAGDAFFYAFMAGFGDSLQNFGAALAGRGPVANPGATMDRIIQRSIDIQTEQKQADHKNGLITADQLTAERERVRLKLVTVGKQMAETRAARAKNEDERIALAAVGKKFDAEQADAIAEAAKATARHDSVAKTTSTSPGTPGGYSMFGGEKEDWASVKAHAERQAGADQQERAVSRLEKATGLVWDEKANNGAGGYANRDDIGNVPGTTALGTNFKFLAGEGGREVQGAIDDLAAGDAKAKDPVGAVSDKSVAASKDAMAATTDEGLSRAMERTRRQLRSVRGNIDAGFSPGVVKASRIRRGQEGEFQSSKPGLPKSRPATPEDLE
jgi:hypothetical protein